MIERVDTPTIAGVDHLVRELSNWGRWGSDDELGTLNLVTPETRRAGAALVRGEAVVSLARRLGPRYEPDNQTPVLHLMRRSGETAGPGFSTASDWFGLAFHGFGVTHVDALSHVMWHGEMYNGVPATQVSTANGARRLSVEPITRGVTSRGVFLDAPRALGWRWLEPGAGLTPDDLDACAERQGVTVESGDVLIVRTGRDVRRRELGASDPIVEGLGGLAPSCIAWIRHRDVALLVTDGTSDVMLPGGAPHLMPVHVVGLVAMGMPLVDNADLEDLSHVCESLGRWTFMFVMAPLRLQGGTGSPVTPLALL